MSRFKLLIPILFLYSLLISVSVAKINTQQQPPYFSYSVTGKGAPIVLLHAFPTDQQLWAPQRLSLKSHFKVITLDLRGFGASSPANEHPLTMESYADEVNNLLNKLHIKKAIIGGESMGGYVALAFLDKYPNRVKGLILSDTQAIADTDEVKAKREASAVDILNNGPQNYLQGFMLKALSQNASEQIKHQLKVIVDRQPADGMAAALRGMALRLDYTMLLSQTEIPILIMTGDNDILISPTQSQAMAKLAKNSHLIVINNAGHLSNLEQPEQWNQAVINMYGR